MSMVTFHSVDEPRPRGAKRVDAWHECEVAPCGEDGKLTWHYWSRRLSSERLAIPDLSDIRAFRHRPWLLTIWEPLITKAPGPHLASAFCCYIQTVIFYHAPYVASPWVKLFQYPNGRWSRNGSAGHFEEWDKIETRLSREDQVEFEGEIFEIGGGRVLWTHALGEPRRWWMRHGARRKQEPRR